MRKIVNEIIKNIEENVKKSIINEQSISDHRSNYYYKSKFERTIIKNNNIKDLNEEEVNSLYIDPEKFYEKLLRSEETKKIILKQIEDINTKLVSRGGKIIKQEKRYQEDKLKQEKRYQEDKLKQEERRIKEKAAKEKERLKLKAENEKKKAISNSIKKKFSLSSNEFKALQEVLIKIK